MTQFTQNAGDTETSSQYAGIRLAELIDQDWNRNKSAKLAMLEGIGAEAFLDAQGVRYWCRRE